MKLLVLLAVPLIVLATPQCPCDTTKVWNDIFLLLDGSNVLTQNKFDQMTVFVQSALGILPIGQDLKYKTRIGVATYGNNVQLQANLTTYTNQADFLTVTYQPLGQEHTNIKAAIDLATDHFQNPREHRQTSRKVIVIGASSYREGNYDLPLTVAQTFKDNGGIIMVVAYGDLRGETSAVLRNISSPGYYIDASSTNNVDPDILSKMQCTANCFCPTGYFPVSQNVTKEPSDGCFFSSDLEALQILAKRTCTKESNGLLAMVKDQQQKGYVVSKYKAHVPILIGLEFVNQNWVWEDGTIFTDKITKGVGNCATLQRTTGFNTEITQVDCFGGSHNYACQAVPCSTTNFCAAN